MKKNVIVLLLYVLPIWAMEKTLPQASFSSLPTDIQKLIVQQYGIEKNTITQEIKRRRIVCKKWHSFLAGKEQFEKLAKIWSAEYEIGCPLLLQRIKLADTHPAFIAWQQESDLGRPSNRHKLRDVLSKLEHKDKDRFPEPYLEEMCDNCSLSDRSYRYEHLGYIPLPDGNFFSLFNINSFQLMIKYKQDGIYCEPLLPVVIQAGVPANCSGTSFIVEKDCIRIINKFDDYSSTRAKISDRTSILESVFDFDGSLIHESESSYSK